MERILHVGRRTQGPATPHDRSVRLVVREIELSSDRTVQPALADAIVEGQIRERIRVTVIGEERNEISFSVADRIRE